MEFEINCFGNISYKNKRQLEEVDFGHSVSLNVQRDINLYMYILYIICSVAVPSKFNYLLKR